MKLRVARHTNQLSTIVDFYEQILGMCNLGSFRNYSNYDGTILAFDNHDWQLEFTQSDEKANHTFDLDDLLVFYPGNQRYDDLVQDLIQQGIVEIKPKNPYWEKNGFCFSDPDGFTIVIAKYPVARN